MTADELRAMVWGQGFAKNRTPRNRARIGYAAYLMAAAGDEEFVTMVRRELLSQVDYRSPLEESLGPPAMAAATDIPGKYRTRDGHWVRSKSERDIANFLFDQRIPYAYERRTSVGGRDIWPDFFLPDLGEKGIFLEHFGGDSAEYLRQANEKARLFKVDGKKLIATNETDSADIEASLIRKLGPYLRGRDDSNRGSA